MQTTIFEVSCASSGCHGGSAWPDLSAEAYGNIVRVESTQGLPLVGREVGH